MKELKEFFTPFGKLCKRDKTIMIIVQLSLFLIVWSLATLTFLPKPLEIIDGTLRMLREDSLILEMWISIQLCIKAMLIAVTISAIISYGSTIPAIRSFTLFVSNARFLSLFGLSFFFTLLTSSGDSLKTSLLVFSIVVFFTNSYVDVIDKIDKGQYLLAKTLGMNAWKTLFYVVIWGTLADLFIIAGQTFAIAWAMLSTIENLSRSGGGIAVLLFNENKYLHFDSVFGAQILIYLTGMLFVFGIMKLRTLACPHTKYEGI